MSFERYVTCGPLCLMMTITVVCSIVNSRLDYCNSLLAGTSVSNLAKPKRVQNTLARVVLRRGKYDHISSALDELHWLPVKQRITFKLCTLAFNIKRTNQLSYQRQLLIDYEPTRCLRSSTQDFIRVDRSRCIISSRANAQMRGTVFQTQFAKLIVLLILKLNSRLVFLNSHLLTSHRRLRTYEYLVSVIAGDLCSNGTWNRYIFWGRGQDYVQSDRIMFNPRG
jgi:hypothetical protein